MRIIWTLFIAAAFLTGCVTAKKETPNTLDEALTSGAPVRGITPIFSQLVSIMQPKGFIPAFENTKPDFYIQEWVLRGENVQKWTQMITLTGNKNMALNPKATPTAVASFMAQGFRFSCPTNYSFASLGDMKINNHDGTAVVTSCGLNSKGLNAYSETTLIISIKGEKDFYSIQWAERGPASTSPIPIDMNKWKSRLEALSPIKICSRIPGETAPYPSCT